MGRLASVCLIAPLLACLGGTTDVQAQSVEDPVR